MLPSLKMESEVGSDFAQVTRKRVVARKRVKLDADMLFDWF